MEPLVKCRSTSSQWRPTHKKKKKKINDPKGDCYIFYSFCIISCFYYLRQIYFQRLLYAMGKFIKSLHWTSLFLHLTFYKLEISWCSQNRLYLSVLEKGKESWSLQSRPGIDVWVMIRTIDLGLSFNHSQGQSLVDRDPLWQDSILSFRLRLQGRCRSVHSLQKGFRKPTVKSQL